MVSLNSSSVSPGKPTIMSVVSTRSGMLPGQLHLAEILCGIVIAAVHGPQHPVGAGLHRQVDMMGAFFALAIV